ncbi:MAG: tRNA uracil 4-sulfurtransferase ThiI [Erysipelotrichaceae bacterium]
MDKLVYEYILIRYGELTTKGKNKNEFIKKLADNMKSALNSYPKLVFERTRDHIYIHLNGTDPDELTPILENIFGIRSFSKTLKVENSIEAIVNASRDIMKDKEGTFKVVTKRANKKFEFRSDIINRMVASEILKNFAPALKVDVHNPDYRLIIEIREKNTYIMAETILGSQGFPVGVGGKAMLMLSGGIDSPVAGYLVMKRGVKIECIHYASMPYTSLESLNKVKELARIISVFQGKIKLHIIPFTAVQMEIYRICDEAYAITMMRRMMYRLAQRLAEKNGCLAIVNGESIGQVASQTLQSIAAISEVVDMPVIRPCATLDKLEIISIAKEINTYETSILPYEDCCTIFTPKNPVIKPKKEKCRWYEEKYDFEPFLKEALENVESIVISPTAGLADDEDLF